MALRRSPDGSVRVYNDYDFDPTVFLVQILRSSHISDMIDPRSSNQVIRRSSKPYGSNVDATRKHHCYIRAPHNTRTGPAKPRKSSLKSKSRPRMSGLPARPKKQVRFDLTPKTESDNIYLGKTAVRRRSAEAKRSSIREKEATKSRTPDTSSCKPVCVALGLSAINAMIDAKKERSQRKPTKPYEQEMKPTTHKVHDGARSKPVVFVSPDNSVLGDRQWATVKKRYTYGWE